MHVIPLTQSVLSLRLDYHFFGNDLRLFHMTNILLHGLATVLVCSTAKLLAERALSHVTCNMSHAERALSHVTSHMSHAQRASSHVASHMSQDRLGRRRPSPQAFALVTGLVFAVHTIHTEAVANLTGRADILCLVCMLLSLQAYIYALDCFEGRIESKAGSSVAQVYLHDNRDKKLTKKVRIYVCIYVQAVCMYVCMHACMYCIYVFIDIVLGIITGLCQ
jgi:hypothetical protein